jgi:Protein of unknown function (DUF3501)
MAKLTLADISDLREYERERDEFRTKVIAEKRLRRVALGPLVTVVFENALTMRFQIQEMARAEKLATDEAIQSELDAYNPLIPGPGELSLTMFIELTSEAELREWLPKLVGIEGSVGVSLGGGELVRCEVEPEHESQLTRADITASVHYLRVQLSEAERSQFAVGPARLVVDHPAYSYATDLDDSTRASLVADW